MLIFREPRTSSSTSCRRATWRIVGLGIDIGDDQEPALGFHHGADVQLGAPLARAPGSAGRCLARIDEELGQRPARCLGFVLLEAAGLDEAPRGCVRHEDLTGLANLWT